MPNWENFHNLSFVNRPLFRRLGDLQRNSSSEKKTWLTVKIKIVYSNADLASLNNYIAQLGGTEGGKISLSSLSILHAGQRTWLQSEKTLSELIKNMENIASLGMKSFANNASSQLS